MDATISTEKLRAACEAFPKHPVYRPSYGTAGFRAEASLLHSTLFRCGVLMALRAVKTGGTTGLVVTASHNPAEDNGVKMVDPSGYMLLQSWEAFADHLANAEDCSALCLAVKQICTSADILHGRGRVRIGYDTRSSSVQLVEAAKAGVEAVGGSAEILGLLTTPQLHWMVWRGNLGLPDSEADYYAALGKAFQRLVEGTAAPTTPLFVDCANGVGAQKLETFQRCSGVLQVELRNTGAGILNGGCGADAVQKGQEGEPCWPAGFEGVPLEARCASIDGDADRVVYFTHIGDSFALFDGDRIAALAALLVRKLVAPLESKRHVRLGVVQTAYANGSSTRYLRESLGLEVKLAKTGVKHLHHMAATFDIGIYFEANGHGTILFRESLLSFLEEEARRDRAAADLLDLATMVNQAVGDAISGILLVEAGLRRLKWNLSDLASVYADLPSCMLKVKVPDRSVFTTIEAETKVATPENLQHSIDAAVAGVTKGRSFVRPSGTEDVVRVYAEAETHPQAVKLARAVALLAEQAVGRREQAASTSSYIAR